MWAAFVGWLVPGWGHILQGRIGKGLLFSTCVIGLFLWGYAMGHGRVVYLRWDEQEHRWPYFAQIGAGALALPALIPHRDWLPERWAAFEAVPTDAELDDLHRKDNKRMELAVVYTMVAGLLNILVVFDALTGPADDQRRENRSSPAREV